MGRSAHETSTLPANRDDDDYYATSFFPSAVTPTSFVRVEHEHAGLISPSVGDVYAADRFPLLSPSDSLLTPCPAPDATSGLDAGILSTMPDDVVPPPLLSPQEPGMRVRRSPSPVISGPLAIIPSTCPPTAPPAAKEGPGGLRLPSFQQLGIASPHPDRLVSPILRDDGTILPGFDGLGLESGGASDPDPWKGDGGRAVQSPVYHFVTMLTPPTDSGPMAWDSQPAVQTAGMHSPPAQMGNDGEQQTAEIRSTGDVDDVATALPEQVETLSGERVGSGEQRAWMDDAVSVLLQNLHATSRPSASFKVLSHALPSTSTTGHIFPRIINAIHKSNPASPVTPMTWINVFHAIPGRFNLADLPSSPPSTPGPAIGGDDYFTQKTFDSAVSIADYQVATALLPRSPRPVVPPSSIDISIVERYIPPSTLHEFAEMFDPNGSSILVDRLVELSPQNGSLLFIYPTKRGAETFMHDYLGPVLDPLLRTMSVVDGLPADLCRSIGTMSAVPAMLSHDSLRAGITSLCNKLSHQETAAQRFHPGSQRPHFSVTYSASRRVHLPRSVWAREWWVKQEKVRIKEILTHRHPRESRRLSIKDFGAPATTGTVLLQSLLDGVVGKESLEREIPGGEGIEVSIFVVKRSL